MRIQIENQTIKIYNPGYTTIENELYWNGWDGWEKISLALWKNYSKDSAIIFDIGSNTGIYSLVASNENPNAEIYAFEPVKRTAQLLKKNLELNSTFKIQMIEKAVSNQNGKATFYDVPSQSQYSASLNPEMLNQVNEIITYEIETITLDTFKLLENKKVDLIKLDVEMHEPEAIEGMIEIIRRDKPTILVEILTNEIGHKIEALIKGLDYIFYEIDEINPPLRVSKLHKSKCYNFLLTQNKLD
jgi:FkbM family methyltransferase